MVLKGPQLPISQSQNTHYKELRVGIKKTASGKNDSRGHIKKPVNVAGKQGHTEVVVYETCIPLAW